MYRYRLRVAGLLSIVDRLGVHCMLPDESQSNSDQRSGRLLPATYHDLRPVAILRNTVTVSI